MLRSAIQSVPRLLVGGILPLSATALYGQSVNPVIEWNRNLLLLVRTPGMQPATVHSTRSFAIMHLSVERAVNAAAAAADTDAEAMERIAAIAAAHRALIRLYPKAEADLTREFQNSLGAVPKPAGFPEALALGRRSADAVLRGRSGDGAEMIPPPYAFGAEPGSYQSTPPNFPEQPQLRQWGSVLPFVLRSGDQFRPGPPPALESALYSRALTEVQQLGTASGSAATPEQMAIGKFWNGTIQNYWNEIAQSACLKQNLDLRATAGLFARMNAAMADATIAFYDAKYTYNFWRPVTAIRQADGTTTTPDPLWLPLSGNTAPDPSYPGAHAAIGAAAAEVLVARLGTDWLALDVTSEAVAGVTRHFDSISAISDEASRSRVYAGAHFSFDLTAGERLGRQVAGYVLEHLAAGPADRP